MAERIPSEDRVGDEIPPDGMARGSGIQDIPTEGDFDLRDRVRQPHEDIVRAKEKRREEVESAHPRVFGSGTSTDDPDGSVGTVSWEFGYGWDELVANLASMIEREIDRDPSVAQGDQPFAITQMKEKFGLLRVYYFGGNPRIQGMIAMTEHLSAGICEICGGIGTMHSSGGWMKTLCEECGTLYDYRPMPQPELPIGDPPTDEG